jgi:hypothetical protein
MVFGFPFLNVEYPRCQEAGREERNQRDKSSFQGLLLCGLNDWDKYQASNQTNKKCG